ncbi:MAG: 8-amino-7-oxononanoate synthase [Acidobacteria bacterium]|nr:8-amino-7-oxononanoate synthase [Acidobacteriota bacterium]
MGIELMEFSTLKQRVYQELSELEKSGLRRRLNPPLGIDLSSNDYLALSSHPFIKENMAQAVLKSGCGSTASRLLRGERREFAEVEKLFASFKGTKSALYFNSGYMANIGVITSFLNADDLVFSDQFNHASLIDGLRLSRAKKIIFPHCNLKALKELLEKETCLGQKFLVTESLFSMDGDQAPLKEYAELCEKTNTALIVDEAHAIGIYGPYGTGLIEETAIGDSVFLSINPAGKALGVSGAFVAGPDWAIDYLIQSARSFIFSTAPPPAIAAALETSLTIINKEPERRKQLLDIAIYLRELLILNEISIPAGNSQIIPVVLGSNERASNIALKLQQAGFDVRAIRPPTVPVGTSRLRISLNINLDQNILREFTNTLKKVMG